MKKQSVVVLLLGAAMLGAFADNAFDYYSLTNRENQIKWQRPDRVQTPIPLPSKEVISNLFAYATNSIGNARSVSYIMDIIGRSVYKFPDAYSQQEVELYAFNCLTNAISIPDSLYWTCYRGGDRMKGELIRGVFLSMPVVATNRNAIGYLADYIGSIPVITLDRQLRSQEFQRAKALDDAREDKQGYRGFTGPELKAHFAKWRRLEIEKSRWREISETYFRYLDDIADRWKCSFSSDDFNALKTTFIERARLTPEDVKYIFR